MKREKAHRRNWNFNVTSIRFLTLSIRFWNRFSIPNPINEAQGCPNSVLEGRCPAEAASEIPPIPSFTTPYISPLIQFTWRSEWKAVSEFGPYVHQKDCRFCTVCLRFNNHLRRAAPVTLKDLSWTLSRKLWINPNSPFTINLYLCCIMLWRSGS